MVKRIDPDGVSRRLNDLQRHRGQYIVPGPKEIYQRQLLLQHNGVDARDFNGVVGFLGKIAEGQNYTKYTNLVFVFLSCGLLV